METQYLSHEEEKVYIILKEIIDPEIGINIIDLGLVYDIHYSEYSITVMMTLTTPACPLADIITAEAEERISHHFPDHQVEVRLTWEPAWNPDLINEDGRKMLRFS